MVIFFDLLISALKSRRLMVLLIALVDARFAFRITMCFFNPLHLCSCKKKLPSSAGTRSKSGESIAYRRQCMQVRDPSWLCNPGQTSPEVQNRSVSGSTKRTDVLQIFFKKTTELAYSVEAVTDSKLMGTQS